MKNEYIQKYGLKVVIVIAVAVLMGLLFGPCESKAQEEPFKIKTISLTLEEENFEFFILLVDMWNYTPLMKDPESSEDSILFFVNALSNSKNLFELAQMHAYVSTKFIRGNSKEIEKIVNKKFESMIKEYPGGVFYIERIRSYLIHFAPKSKFIPKINKRIHQLKRRRI